MWIDILKAFLTLGIIGLVLGASLSLAGNLLHVHEDERKKRIMNVLPGADCGACGYAGCSEYAEALLQDDPDCARCPVAKAEGAEAIAAIMGRHEVDFREMVAHIRCHGTHDFANRKYIYYGMNDCEAANRLLGGYMTCQYGCLGFGNCVKKCPEEAISIRNGVAMVDRERCNGCGICLSACPKNVIEMIPKDSRVLINCASKDKGTKTRVACNIGCIGCKNCQKSCPEGAVSVKGNISVIDYDKCIGCGSCAENCPRNIIEIPVIDNEE